eukprot:CAMPEP_0182480934 /NCGR_PEP_ID=MMETSP1319-20130603/36538_1 /TAXON_ID=172717 /ORGANISM="Bolidomonas pacifica, Strain RCC208" /LENGTH=244 /DNA_ID=CAMNT_0024682495 /DNA_START=48 /DNA_END=778 /DNA_ORIENTATION=+
MANMDPIISEAQEWAEMDASISPQCSAAVREAIVSNNLPYLRSCGFGGVPRIAFGTAGLRSKMMPGPANMNDLVIIQTAQGLARYVQKVNEGAGELKAVVGYDHRENKALGISSARFAQITKAVFTHAGISTVLLDGLVPTPFVPFAVRELGCCCGVMVTASHNPKEDDGYKLYWSNSCQITPPHDSGISSSILQNLTPWSSYDLTSASPSTSQTSSLLTSYLASLHSSLCFSIYPSLLSLTPP